MDFPKTNLLFESIISSLLEEGFKDKIAKLEIIYKNAEMSIPADTVELIKRKESIFDWNKVFSFDDKSEVANDIKIARDITNEINRQITKEIDKVVSNNKSNEKLYEFLNQSNKYMNSNNYSKSFNLLLLSDFANKFKKTAGAIPKSQAFIISDVYNEVKDKNDYGSLVKIYQKVEKKYANVDDEGNVVEQKNTWIVIPSYDNDPDNFETNKKKLQAYSNCKTGWCVRDESRSNSYLSETDFHLYLDEDGDAVVSIRVDDDNLIQEISGTENGNEQHVSDQYVNTVVKYVNGGELEMPEIESLDFNQKPLLDLLGEYRNYSEYTGIFDGSGDEDVDNYYGQASEHYDDFIQYTKTDEDVIADYLAQEYGLEIDEEGLWEEEEFREKLDEYLESEYDFSVHTLVEWASKASVEKSILDSLKFIAEDVAYNSGLVEVIDGGESHVVWKEVKPSSEAKNTSIEQFFANGQPQIQEYDGGVDPLETYLEENHGDLEAPYGGWDNWDDDEFASIIGEYIPYEFTKKFYDKRLQDVHIRFEGDDHYIKAYMMGYTKERGDMLRKGVNGYVLNGNVYTDHKYGDLFIGKVPTGKLSKGLKSGDTFTMDYTSRHNPDNVYHKDAFQIKVH